MTHEPVCGEDATAYVNAWIDDSEWQQVIIDPLPERTN